MPAPRFSPSPGQYFDFTYSSGSTNTQTRPSCAVLAPKFEKPEFYQRVAIGSCFLIRSILPVLTLAIHPTTALQGHDPPRIFPCCLRGLVSHFLASCFLTSLYSTYEVTAFDDNDAFL